MRPRVAVIAGIALDVLIVLAVGIYIGAFVILSPTTGRARERDPSGTHHGVKLIPT
jgi:hypothetical protein